MISLEREIYRKAKSGEISHEELANYLLRNYTIFEIALSLAETIEYEAPKPIVISEEEFFAHFRIRGKRNTGEEERRGRPRADSTP